jgi:hypothetical protein
MKSRGALCEAAECANRVDSAEGYAYARFRTPDGVLMPAVFRHPGCSWPFAQAPEWERVMPPRAPKAAPGEAWTGATS